MYAGVNVRSGLTREFRIQQHLELAADLAVQGELVRLVVVGQSAGVYLNAGRQRLLVRQQLVQLERRRLVARALPVPSETRALIRVKSVLLHPVINARVV